MVAIIAAEKEGAPSKPEGKRSGWCLCGAEELG